MIQVWSNEPCSWHFTTLVKRIELLRETQFNEPFPSTERLSTLLYLTKLRLRRHGCYTRNKAIHEQRILRQPEII